MIITTDGLTQVADEATEPIIDAPLKDALMRGGHDLSATTGGPTTIGRIASSSVTRPACCATPERRSSRRTRPCIARRGRSGFACYVTPAGGPFGAYTVTGKAGGVITTMSCRDAGYQGFRALEMLLHESSHAIVSPSRGTVGAAITAAAKQRGMRRAARPLARDSFHDVGRADAPSAGRAGRLRLRALVRGAPHESVAEVSRADREELVPVSRREGHSRRGDRQDRRRYPR